MELLRDAVGDVAKLQREGGKAWIDDQAYRTCACGYIAHDIPDLVIHAHRSCSLSVSRSAEARRENAERSKP